jgi:hypothetical protein
MNEEKGDAAGVFYSDVTSPWFIMSMTWMHTYEERECSTGE